MGDKELDMVPTKANMHMVKGKVAIWICSLDTLGSTIMDHSCKGEFGHRMVIQIIMIEPLMMNDIANQKHSLYRKRITRREFEDQRFNIYSP